MKDIEKMKVGDLLVRDGYITDEQLSEALLIQKQRSKYIPIGEICIELHFISKAMLKNILRLHQKHIPLGELIVNMGLVTPEQMETALEDQKVSKKKLGETLITNGFITEADLVDSLAIQLGIPKITPDINLIDKSLLQGLSQPFLFKHEFLPAFKELKGDAATLTVIMSDPLDEETIHTLRNFFGCNIEPAIAAKSQLNRTINHYFNKLELGPLLTQNTENSFKETTFNGLVIGGTDLSKASGDSIVEILNFLISSAISEGASDIHIEPMERTFRVRFRVDGILCHKTDLPKSIIQNVISRIKVLCGLDISEKRRHQDGRIEARIMGQEMDLRVSTYASMWGENIVIRILHRQSTLIDLDELGFSPINRAMYNKIVNYPSGIILATGPTGSGKTTTLYASLQYLNAMDKMIITVEDPVEYTIEGVVQGKIDAKLGLTYMDFLKSMMRQDPDVIMIGEIRDSIAADAAIQASLTGHKVFSTFHTDDTTGALLRLMDMGIDTFLISSTVVSIVAQRLVRRLCSKCKTLYTPEESIFNSFCVHGVDTDKYNFYTSVGCKECNYTGFKGRTAIHEVLVVNDAIRDAILERKPSSHIRMVAREKANLISMRDDGFYKATEGITSLEEIVRVVFYNEGDELTTRHADELVATCKMEDSGGLSDLGLPFHSKDGAPVENRVVHSGSGERAAVNDDPRSS